MKTLSITALTLALSFVVGCTTKTIPGPLVVSNRPLPELGTVEADAKPVSGESCARAVLLIIPIGVGTVDSAYADALSQAPGADTIVDYQERQNSLFAFPFYYQYCTEVRGYAVSSKSKTPAKAE